MDIDRASPPMDFVPCFRCRQATTPTGPRTLCYACVAGEAAFADERRELEASIPASYQWSTLDAPELPLRVLGGVAMVARARAVALAPRLLLLGDSGAGKTSLAVAMLREWASARRSGALFVSVPHLAGARMRSPLGREADDVSLALHAPLVLLDDLGGEMPIPTSPITDVIRWRHEQNKPTWATTWLDVEGLTRRYGEGIARRLGERAVVIRVPEPKP